jgi:hypothetical protein
LRCEARILVSSFIGRFLLFGRDDYLGDDASKKPGGLDACFGIELVAQCWLSGRSFEKRQSTCIANLLVGRRRRLWNQTVAEESVHEDSRV